MIMADDIGWFNVSAYNLGLMGYKTPNIDRIAKEGALFTDWYGEQSCTAGRAAFITGQSPIRTGLSESRIPRGPLVGLSAQDMSVAEALKPLGYATAQFGKNHLVDFTTNCAQLSWPTAAYAVSRRKGYELGRWLSRTDGDALARYHSARHHL